jgi:hypothetical protein
MNSTDVSENPSIFRVEVYAKHATSMKQGDL